MSTIFGTTASSAVSATIEIITISKFSLNPQPQLIPIFWVFKLISLDIIGVFIIRTTVTLKRKCTFPFAKIFPFGSSDSMFCLFPKSRSSDTGILMCF